MRHNQNSIILLTYNNTQYSTAFEKAGLHHLEYPMPISEKGLDEIKNLPETFTVVFEISKNPSENEKKLLPILERFKHKICISVTLTESSKALLFCHGIPDFLDSPHPTRLIHYIHAIDLPTEDPRGSIVILDHEANHRNLFATIISRFQYESLFAASVSSIIEYSKKQNIVFIIINLGLPSLDIKNLIREFTASSVLKRIPFLIFSDMKRGIFIHELLSGLNRITTYILSPEETFSFLLEILYRKEIIPRIAELQKIYMDSCIDFANEPLARIYYSFRNELFQLKSLLENETMQLGESHIDSIKKSLIKVDGLRWLISQKDESARITCGLGASV